MTIKKSDIKTLVEACIRKDTEAWSKFINHFSELVGWAARDRLKRWGIQFGSEDIEDIKQQAFLNIWQKNKLAEIRDREKIGSWLVIVAGNFAFNYYIRTKKGANTPVLESIFSQRSRIENISDTNGAYSVLEANEIKTLVSDFINKLPEQHQTILTLNYFYGKSHREISEILKISVNTVSTIIKRTKDALRKDLKSKGYENF